MARKKTIEDEKRLAVRLEGELHEQAMEKAKESGKTLSDIIRALLLGWLSKPDPKDQKNE